MSWDQPPDGYSLCFVQTCTYCAGSGVLVSTYCAANDMPGGGTFDGRFNSGSGTSSPCPHCIRGFSFVKVDTSKALVHMLREALGEDVGNVGNVHPQYPKRDVRQALLDVIVKATEERMTEGVRGT